METLEQAVAVWVIGHEKTKNVTLKDGSEYNLTTLNCLGKTIDIIEREADMIIYGDMIKTVKDGEVAETRQLRFRSDGNIICGSRFRTMPDMIDLDVKLFLETFKDAVLASLNHNGEKNGEEQLKKLVAEQTEERETKAEVYTDKESNPEKSPEQYIVEIGELIAKLNADQQTELKKQFKEENGSVNYKKYENAEQFENALRIANSLLV